MSNADATATATYTERRVQIGKGVHVHRANNDGNTYCGSQRRMGRSSYTSFLPNDTAVTCTKCGADAPAPVAPVATPAVDDRYCPNHSYRVQREDDGSCFMCGEW